MITVDPITQVEKYSSPSLGIMGTYLRPFMSQYESMFGLPKYSLSSTKPSWYKLNLPKRFKDVPYEDRQEVRRLLYTLRKMDNRSEYETIMLYKFR